MCRRFVPRVQATLFAGLRNFRVRPLSNRTRPRESTAHPHPDFEKRSALPVKTGIHGETGHTPAWRATYSNPRIERRRKHGHHAAAESPRDDQRISRRQARLRPPRFSPIRSIFVVQRRLPVRQTNPVFHDLSVGDMRCDLLFTRCVWNSVQLPPTRPSSVVQRSTLVGSK